jgi:hypothetical protein
MNTIDGKTMLQRMGDFVLKSKPALLITLFALLIPTQIVKANPSPPPEARLIEYFLNNFFVVFLLTFGVEFLVVSARGPDKMGGRDLGFSKTAIAVAAINLFTLGCLWSYIRIASGSYRQFFLLEILVLEFLVVAVEAWFYSNCFEMPFRKALILSFMANLASYFAGLIIFISLAPKPNPFENMHWDGANTEAE